VRNQVGGHATQTSRRKQHQVSSQRKSGRKEKLSHIAAGFRDLPSRFAEVSLCAMSAILKDDEFVPGEAAIKAGIALQPVAAVFNRLSALRAKLEKSGAPESHHLHPMNFSRHHRVFATSHLCNSN
jgi:hypothetical protein